MDIKENTEVLFSKLENFFKTETVVGKPIQVGDITLVPFITVTFGCGTGGGEGTDPKSNQEGGGSGIGAGAKITPNAVLVIKGDTIQMLPIGDKNNLSKLMELVPNIVSKLKKKNEKKENI
ncbi:spore germination protein GerW family protein [Clostridium sp. AWRP]|uniref:GerW family sporulation protein n=1 Tax=Clostridium sp. AWRP TaxID=2212991 RepID=UPI000FD77BC0|nr:spore germination protein GerW family protein [Clostridium sp. AWRP]AZV58103.1 sporulation protein [Clostridium sp. AWRP]